jgi:hypothetical protein
VQSRLRLSTRCKRTGALGKRAEQCVALGIDQASTVPLDAPHHDLVMPLKDVGEVLFPNGAQKRRAALDVGEQERHLAAREHDLHQPLGRPLLNSHRPRATQHKGKTTSDGIATAASERPPGGVAPKSLWTPGRRNLSPSGFGAGGAWESASSYEIDQLERQGER